MNGGGSGFSSLHTEANRWDSQWPQDGWEYAVSVRASGGDTIKGGYTVTQSAIATPQLAPPPSNVQVQGSTRPLDGVKVTWDAPEGKFTDSIVGYNITIWDCGPRHCQLVRDAAFRSSPGEIKWLLDGINYKMAIFTWNENGQGLPSIAPNIILGKGTPPVPSGLVLDTIDATSAR